MCQCIMLSSALRLYAGCCKLCPEFFFILHICDKYINKYLGLLYLFLVELNERPFDRLGGHNMGKTYLRKSMCWFPTIILSPSPVFNYRYSTRLSRGSVLAFGTQVRGFKPGRSRRIFRAKKSSGGLPSEGK